MNPVDRSESMGRPAAADQQRRRAPASFGRPAPDEEENFTIRGGQALHLVVHADITPSATSVEQLFETIRRVTREAVLAGYADAFAQMDTDEQDPGGGDGGAPPGESGDGG